MSVFEGATDDVLRLNEHLRDVLNGLDRMKRGERGAGKRTQQTSRRGGRDYSQAPYIPPWTGGRSGFGGEGFGESGSHARKPPGGGG